MSLISDRPPEGSRPAFSALEPRWRSLLETFPDAVVLTDAAGRIVYSNTRADRLFGYPDGELAGKSIDVVMRGVISPATATELCGLRRDASEFPIEVTRGRLESREGPLVIIAIRDIAQRKSAEKELARTAELTNDAFRASDEHRIENEGELRESERRFKTMLANIELLAVMMDRQGRITYCNDYLLRLTGWQLAQVKGRDFIDLFIRGEAAALRKVFADLLRDDSASWHHENEIFTRSGESRLIQWNNTVLRSPAGDVIGTASIGKDVTMRKRAEEEVRRLTADLELRVAERTSELEAANKELEAFDYSISHDLRGPLGRIQGFAAVLLEESGAGLGAEGKDFVQRIHAASQEMNQLIDDLLELSLVTRGDLDRRVVDLSALARRVLDALRKADPEREVEIVVEPDLHARADPGLMRIVLENLLENAWKFTARRPDARIEFGTRNIGRRRAFVVADNGAGFDAAHATRLFDPFRRQHSQSEFRGTGIGLATVQRIMRRHGGRVWAESEVGSGATFFFILSP